MIYPMKSTATTEAARIQGYPQEGMRRNVISVRVESDATASELLREKTITERNEVWA